MSEIMVRLSLAVWRVANNFSELVIELQRITVTAVIITKGVLKGYSIKKGKERRNKMENL